MSIVTLEHYNTITFFSLFCYNETMSRRAKQVIYGILYLAILGGIITGIYFLFLRPSPSCFDGIQNEGEQGVDCGGPCATACLPSNTQPISPLGAVQVFSPLKGHVTVLAHLENMNADSGASLFDYTVTLYGIDGSTTVATLPGSSFAYADETKYIVFPNVAVTSSVSRADITINDTQWMPADQMGFVPQFTFTNEQDVASGNGYVTVNGNITDRDVASFNNVIIVAIFKDAAGMPIGASETELDSIAPGDTQSFSISYPAVPNENISATELHAYAERH
jgi:hypothetical protein